MKKRRYIPPTSTDADAEPFPTPAEAWFWCVRCLEARADGARFKAGLGDVQRPCEPDDILAGLERLWRRGKLAPAHLSVLWDYGRQSLPPDARNRGEELAARLWDEALDLLTTLWRPRGIVR